MYFIFKISNQFFLIPSLSVLELQESVLFSLATKQMLLLKPVGMLLFESLAVNSPTCWAVAHSLRCWVFSRVL